MSKSDMYALYTYVHYTRIYSSVQPLYNYMAISINCMYSLEKTSVCVYEICGQLYAIFAYNAFSNAEHTTCIMHILEEKYIMKDNYYSTVFSLNFETQSLALQAKSIDQRC